MEEKMPTIYEKFQALRIANENAVAEKDALESTDPVAAYHKSLISLSSLHKAETFYHKIFNALPEEKRDEIFPTLKQICIEKLTKEEFDRLQRFYSISTKATGKKLEQFFYHSHTDSMAKSGATEEIIRELEKHLSEDEREKILQEMDNYVCPVLNNVPIRYFDTEITEQKKLIETEIEDEETRRALNEELDRVNDLVIVSPRRFSDAYGDNLNKIYDNMCDEKNIRIGAEEMQKEKNQKYERYFTDSYTHDSTPTIKEEHYGNTNMAREFCEPEVKIIIPQKTKDFLKKVIGLMKKYELVNDLDSGDEAKHGKTYGFWQIGEATNKLHDAIKTRDLNKIREAREEYELRISQMREIFQVIKEDLDPTFEITIGNLNNFRDVWVPGEFKNDVVINSYANGIYTLMASLNYTGQSLDELLDNPNETFIKIMSENARKISPAVKMQGMSPAQSIAYLLGLNSEMIYPGLGIGRNISIFSPLTHDPSNPETNAQNRMGIMLLSSYNNYLGDVNIYDKRVSIFKYFSFDSNITMANMMLVNDADRDYDKLRAFEALSNDGMTKIPPFDAISYIETHEIDPSELVERLKNTVSEIANSTQKSISAENKALTIQSAQLAALRYTMIHKAPQAGAPNEQAYASLLQMIEHPEIAFEQELNVAHVRDEFNELLKISEFRASTVAKGNKQIKIDRKAARTAESAYNKRMDLLEKEMNAIMERITEADKANQSEATFTALSESLAQKRLEIENLKNLELSRLEEEFKAGRMPKDYFDNRYADVMGNHYKERRPFGVNEYPSRRQFAKKYAEELKVGDLTKEDVDELYAQIMEVALREQNKYSMVLTHISTNPTLSGDVSFHRIENQNANEQNANEQNANEQNANELEIINEEEEPEEEMEINPEDEPEKIPLFIDELDERNHQMQQHKEEPKEINQTQHKEKQP